ncbi:hypothetical protein BDW67DRAFT_170613 [Aspergillus spinulosporus]
MSSASNACTQCGVALASGNTLSSTASKCATCAVALINSPSVTTCYNCGRCAAAIAMREPKGAKYCGGCAEAATRRRL